MGKNKGSGRVGGGGRGNSTVVEFHGLAQAALAAGVASFALDPSGLAVAGFTRPVAIADNYSLFRWRRFRFRLYSNAATSYAAGVGDDVSDTPPATIAQVMELLPAVFINATESNPSNWIKVPPKILAGALPWYKAIPGAATDWEEQPCRLYLAGTTTNAVIVEMYGQLEFRDPVAPANTPAIASLRLEAREVRVRFEQNRERERLLGLLSPSKAKQTPGGL